MPDRPPFSSPPPSPPDPPEGPGRHPAPASLWAAVVRARLDLADERSSPSGHRDSTARFALLGALEAYVLSLAERGHPVPYALRDELRLQRRTCRDRYER